MNQTSLKTITLQTVANYRQVAEQAVGAYRASGHRLLKLMTRSVDRAATRGTDRVAPRVADALRRTSNNVADVAAKGIDTLSTQTQRAITRGSKTVSSQVSRVADLAQRVDNHYVVTGLQAAARMSLGSAQVALTLSQQLAEGADKLSTLIAGQQAPRAKAPAKRTRRAMPANTPKAAAKAVRATVKATRTTKQAMVAKSTKATKAAAKTVRARRVTASA